VVIEPFGASNRFSDAAPFPNNLNLGRLQGWWKTAPVTGLTADFLHAGDANPREGRPTTSFAVAPGDGTVLIRPPATRAAIPVLAPSSLLQELGVDVGIQFPINVDSFNVPVVAPRDAFLSQLGYTGHPRAWPNEVWLRSAAAAADAAALRGQGGAVGQVLVRAELESAQRADPEQLGLASNLLIGFLAAMALAVVAFVVHFVVLTRGRLSEYAILQANGMSRSLIRRSLVAEQGTLLLFAVVVGTAIGLVLAWALLPSIQVGVDLAQVVPPTLVTVDPLVTGGAVLLVAAAAILGGAAGTRLAGRFVLMDELRLLG
jgi:hypothetical protein